MKSPILIFVASGLALTASVASASGPPTPEQKHLSIALTKEVLP